MRRTLAGLLFGIAYACASLTVAGFLLQRAAFDPSRSADASGVVLGDSALKQEIVDYIAEATAAPLGVDAAGLEQYRATIATVASHPDGEQFFTTIIRDSHAHLIGDRSQPVQITGTQLVPILRTEAAADLEPITLPVPEVGILSFANHLLDWLLPIAAIATLVLVGMGLTAHPDKAALLKSLAFGLLLLAVLVAMLGYVLPKFLVPLLDDSAWANLPGRLADDSLALLIALDVLLIGGALGLFAGNGAMLRRRRWSQPISRYRYSEERRWS